MQITPYLFAILALALALGGCGGSTPPVVHQAPDPELFDPPTYLLSYLETHTNFIAPEEDLETLSQALSDASASERRGIQRSIALAGLFEAEDVEDERELRRLTRSTLRRAEQAARGSSDDFLVAEMEFIKLWMGWRADSRQVDAHLDRFLERRTTAGDLFVLAWLLKGERALERDDADAAEEAYRYVTAMIDHPLSGYALLRTGVAHETAGNAAQAQEAFGEVTQLGCLPGASEFQLELSAHAAELLGERLQSRADGVAIPARCETGSENDESANPSVQHLE